MNSFFSQPNAFAQPFQALSPEEEALQRQAMAQRNEQPFTRAQVNQAVAPGGQLPGAPQMPPGPGGGQMPPGLGLTQPMPGGAPGGGGLPGQQGVRDFLGSPGAAMMSAALGNLGRSGPGHPQGGQRVDPIQAYQQGVQRQALLKQQENAAKLREAQAARLESADARAQEKFEIDKDPAYAYTQLKDRGLIPEDMSFVDFETKFGTGATSAPSSVREWKYFNSLSEPDQAAYLEMKRSAQLFGGPGGTTMERTHGGGARTIGAGVEETAAGDATNAATVQSAKDWASTDQKFAAAIQEKGPQLANRVADLNRAVELLESGDGSFGPVASILGNIYDPVNAEINAIAMTGLLQTLSQVSTGALSEGEIEIFSRDLATADKTPAAQRALLKRALTMANRAMTAIKNKGAYYQQNRTLKGYEDSQIQAVTEALERMNGGATGGGAGGGAGGVVDPDEQEFGSTFGQTQTPKRP